LTLARYAASLCLHSPCVIGFLTCARDNCEQGCGTRPGQGKRLAGLPRSPESSREGRRAPRSFAIAHRGATASWAACASVGMGYGQLGESWLRESRCSMAGLARTNWPDAVVWRRCWHLTPTDLSSHPSKQPWDSRPPQTLQFSLLAPSRTSTRVAACSKVPPRHNFLDRLICRLLSSHASKQPLCSNPPSSKYVNRTKCLLAVVHFTSLSPVRHAVGIGLGLRSESFT
jgi:hypothetical protein